MAIITDNWIVVREAGARSQMVIALESVVDVEILKTANVGRVVCGLSCLIVACAAAFSHESDGAVLPFSMVGLGLSFVAHNTRKGAVALTTNGDQVRTAFGSLAEAATVFTAVRSSADGHRWGDRPIYEFLVWLWAYFHVSV